MSEIHVFRNILLCDDFITIVIKKKRNTKKSEPCRVSLNLPNTLPVKVILRVVLNSRKIDPYIGEKQYGLRKLKVTQYFTGLLRTIGETYILRRVKMFMCFHLLIKGF